MYVRTYVHIRTATYTCKRMFIFFASQSITNARDIQQNTLDAISELKNLRVLELGDCESLPNTFTDVLVDMRKLERLRLEKVVNLDPEYRIFSTLRDLPRFEVLELINFEVKIGFDKALSQCENLRELLLIPLYRTQVRVPSSNQ